MQKICFIKQHYLLLICSLLAACEDISLPPPTDKTEFETTSPMVTEAKDFVSTKVLLQPNLQRTLKPGTRAAQLSDDAGESKLVPDWNSMQTYREGWEDVRMFRLRDQETPLYGFVYTRINGKKGRTAVQATSKLVLWSLNGRTAARIFTYLPDKRFLKGGGKIEDLGYRLKGSNYTGFVIVSTLDGHIVYGDKYTRGKHVFTFRPRQKEGKSLKIGEHPAHAHAATPNDTVPPPHIYLSLFTQMRNTRTQLSYSSLESDNLYCSFCNKPVDDCECIEVSPKKKDNEDDEKTVQCPFCGGDITICGCLDNLFGGGSGDRGNGDGEEQIPDGNDREDQNQGAGSGGNGNKPPVTPQPHKYEYAEKLYSPNSTLTDSQKRLLDKCYSELFEFHPATKKLYDLLAKQGFKIAFILDPKIDKVAQFRPGDNPIIAFRNEYGINYLTLGEEIIHATQRYGIYSKEEFNADANERNIEFEAKFFMEGSYALDKNHFDKASSNILYGIPENAKRTVIDLMHSIIKNKGFDINLHWEKYKEVGGAWYKTGESFNTSFYPQLLINYLKK